MTERRETLEVELGAEEAAWLRQLAAATGTSVSDVLTEALRCQRRFAEQRARAPRAARRRLLNELGTDDITEEDLAAVRAEWRR